MNSGKKFEHKISAALKCGKGVYIRLEDGGKVAKNRQLADFLYFPPHNETIAIEVKSTKRKSFPLANIGYGEKDGQAERLTDWQCGWRSSYVAIFFYGEDEKLYLVPIDDFNELAQEAIQDGRSSIRQISLKNYEIFRNGIVYDLGVLDGE